MNGIAARLNASGAWNPSPHDIDEIADGIYRISTWIPEVSPDGFTFNQFLVRGDEPLLFHTGPRALFPLVAEAVSTLIPVESLRWISFGHVEADECGSMNMWLAAAPSSQVAFGALGCDISLNDLCDRPPGRLARARCSTSAASGCARSRTPHVPHGWEAQVLFEETTGTLLCGDLFSQVGAPAGAHHRRHRRRRPWPPRSMFHATCLAPHTAADPARPRRPRAHDPGRHARLRRSRATAAQALHDLADAYERLLASAA